MLETLLLLLVVASWLYWLVAWWEVRIFFRTRPEPDGSFTPPISILKPLRGVDFQAYQNFVSFCRQDYPDFELLFGVADPADPAIPVVRRLQRDFPQHNIRLVVAEAFGANRKASLLHHLADQARHEILVVSDSDMRVTPDYLRRVVAPLTDESVGLVTCPYRGEAALTFTARLEALYMGVTFLPSVIIARKYLAMRFALGATMSLRRRDLARLGGFAAVADYLADDYQLGVRIANLGLRVHLSDYVVTSILGNTTFREQWQREVRWARCSRVSRPWEYPGIVLTFSTPLAALLVLASGFEPWGEAALAVSLLWRWLVAWLITGYTGDWTARRWLVWLPIRDMLSTLIWCAGAIGQHVTWRGEEYVVQQDGRMQPWLASAEHLESFGKRSEQ
ncbi:MAG TPA: glycosyltransferase [Anaerolineae bacterium]|nr:glycosyltransferase [Anaerolineae bacterium]HIQ05640.1 glycosyltransferase [Anaerolineae bacterium]